jgi:hypothetical protein
VFYVEPRRHARTNILALMLCAFGLGAGCRRGPLHLKDSEGRAYSATCKDNGCSIASPNAEPGSSREHVLFKTGRLVGICEVPRGGTPKAANACRPLVCEADDNCPPTQGLGHGTCVNHLCIEPSGRVDVADAVMLCLAGTGWGHASRVQVERYALALNCGSPCRIPAPCRQP